MKTKLIATLLLAGSALFAGPRFSIGIGVGVPAYGYGYGTGYAYSYAPPPPPVAPAYLAPAPGPNYAYVGGYYYPAGARYAWRSGYWAPRPYAGAYWVGPRYNGGRYYAGYWGHRR